MSKAILLRHPGADSLELVHDYKLPARQPGQIKIAVKSSSFNPVDAKLWEGGFFKDEDYKLPKVPSGDVAGIVEECDPESKFKVGDAVYGKTPGWGPWEPLGVWAEHTLGTEAHFAEVPSNISLAGAVPLVSTTAYQALESCNIQPGARLLITAASGGVGHVAVQLAKNHYKAYVVAMTTNADFVKGLGADEIIDYTKEDVSVKYRDEPFDVIVDLLGGEFELKAYGLLSPEATYCHVYNLGTDTARSEKAVKEWTVPRYKYIFAADDGTKLQAISDFIEADTLKFHVDDIFPLEKLAIASEAAELASRKKQGKILIKI